LIALVVGLATKSTGMQDPTFVRPNEAGSLATAQLDQLRSLRWDMRVTSIVRSMLLVAILLAAVPYARRLRRPMGAGLLGLVVLADLLLINVKFIDLHDRSQMEAVLEPTPAIEFLQKQPGPFRVFPLDEFGSNRFVAFGITTVGGMQPAKLRIYQDLLDGQLLSRPPVLSMLNVRYLLSQRDPGLPIFTRVADGVYEYAEAQPRAWFVPSWQALTGEEAVLRALAHPDFDPASVALFSAGRVPQLPSSGLPAREVTIEETSPHLVRLRVGDGDRAGLLVLSEIYYEPGWSASIDGEEAEILPANHCLRALEVPAGQHEIEMRFASRAFRTGRALNRAGGAAIVLLALAGFWLQRRSRREDG
jgi:hypothetical protein